MEASSPDCEQQCAAFGSSANPLGIGIGIGALTPLEEAPHESSRHNSITSAQLLASTAMGDANACTCGCSVSHPDRAAVVAGAELPASAAYVLPCLVEPSGCLASGPAVTVQSKNLFLREIEFEDDDEAEQAMARSMHRRSFHEDGSGSRTPPLLHRQNSLPDSVLCKLHPAAAMARRELSVSSQSHSVRSSERAPLSLGEDLSELQEPVHMRRLSSDNRAVDSRLSNYSTFSGEQLNDSFHERERANHRSTLDSQCSANADCEDGCETGAEEDLESFESDAADFNVEERSSDGGGDRRCTFHQASIDAASRRRRGPLLSSSSVSCSQTGPQHPHSHFHSQSNASASSASAAKASNAGEELGDGELGARMALARTSGRSCASIVTVVRAPASKRTASTEHHLVTEFSTQSVDTIADPNPSLSTLGASTATLIGAATSFADAADRSRRQSPPAAIGGAYVAPDVTYLSSAQTMPNIANAAAAVECRSPNADASSSTSMQPMADRENNMNGLKPSLMASGALESFFGHRSDSSTDSEFEHKLHSKFARIGKHIKEMDAIHQKLVTLGAEQVAGGSGVMLNSTTSDLSELSQPTTCTASTRHSTSRPSSQISNSTASHVSTEESLASSSAALDAALAGAASDDQPAAVAFERLRATISHMRLVPECEPDGDLAGGDVATSASYAAPVPAPALKSIASVASPMAAAAGSANASVSLVSGFGLRPGSVQRVSSASILQNKTTVSDPKFVTDIISQDFEVKL